MEIERRRSQDEARGKLQNSSLVAASSDNLTEKRSHTMDRLAEPTCSDRAHHRVQGYLLVWFKAESQGAAEQIRVSVCLPIPRGNSQPISNKSSQILRWNMGRISNDSAKLVSVLHQAECDDVFLHPTYRVRKFVKVLNFEPLTSNRIKHRHSVGG